MVCVYVASYVLWSFSNWTSCSWDYKYLMLELENEFAKAITSHNHIIPVPLRKSHHFPHHIYSYSRRGLLGPTRAPASSPWLPRTWLWPVFPDPCSGRQDSGAWGMLCCVYLARQHWLGGVHSRGSCHGSLLYSGWWQWVLCAEYWIVEPKLYGISQVRATTMSFEDAQHLN